MDTTTLSKLTSPLIGQQILSLATNSIKLVASILHQHFSTPDAAPQVTTDKPAAVVAPIQTPPAWSSLPEYSLNQVSFHSSPDDCWIVIRDRVYDVTKFISQHPGGFDIMMEQAGRDATLAYRGVGHSDDAEDDLERYLIGILPPRERMYLQKPSAS